jgi:hypothetical protein
MASTLDLPGLKPVASRTPFRVVGNRIRAENAESETGGRGDGTSAFRHEETRDGHYPPSCRQREAPEVKEGKLDDKQQRTENGD